MRLSTAAALLALAAHLPAPVRGHGFQASPRSRQKLAEDAGDESCPHCYNGGSKGNVMTNTDNINTACSKCWPWPYEDPDESTRHGLCGDPSGGSPQPYLPPGEIDTFYEQGSEIEVKVFIKAHHKGHVELRLCQIAAWEDSPSCESLSQECLNEHILLRTSDTGATSGTEHYGPDYWGVYGDTANENYGDCSGTPRDYNLLGAGTEWDGWDPCWPERYHLGLRRSTPDNPDERGWLAQFKVKLPTDLTCKHCVMQMVYVTSNSCSPPGYRSAIQGMTGQSNTGTCGSTDTLYPEEFWNCADVQVYPTGDAATAFDDCQDVTPSTTTTIAATTTTADPPATTTADPQTSTTATDPPLPPDNCDPCEQYDKRNACVACSCGWSKGSCGDP